MIFLIFFIARADNFYYNDNNLKIYYDWESLKKAQKQEFTDIKILKHIKDIKYIKDISLKDLNPQLVSYTLST